VIGATLLILFAVAGVRLSTITENVTKGGKVIIGEVYSTGAGAVSGVTSSATSATTQQGSAAFSDTDKGAYTGTVPCSSLDFSRSKNANVQNGTGGAREWCVAGANALGGKASPKFASACGCGS
jgi:hypothetical protein